MKIIFNSLAVLSLTLMSVSGYAAQFQCKGDYVTQSGSSKYKVKHSGNTIYIEKSGSTRGKAVLRGSKYYVEVSGSTKATFENGKIYKSGSTWAKVSDAKQKYDCPDDVAATLWVLDRVGRL